MVFTRKQVKLLPIKVNNSAIEYVEQHKFLGLMLDSPGLMWKPHINYIKERCISGVNLLKSISHHHWGADRKILLKLYRALVLSKLDYGCILYDTCAKSYLDKLNVIQNNCL
jgi:hypothetical protein